MTRKPSAILDYKLRIREELRRRIEQSAKKRGVSANYEMVSRIESSFTNETRVSLERVAEDLRINWARFGEALHTLNMQSQLLRPAEQLVEALERSNSYQDPSIAKPLERLKTVIRALNREAELRLRKQSAEVGTE